MLLYRTPYMLNIKQFTEELAVYLQCCLSAPHLTYSLVFFFLEK